MEKWKAEKRFPLFAQPLLLRDVMLKRFCDGCKENPASSFILCHGENILRGHPQMERPGFESPLCATSTNRSLSATIRKYRWTGAGFFIEE